MLRVLAFDGSTYTIPDGSVWAAGCRPDGAPGPGSRKEVFTFSGTGAYTTQSTYADNSCAPAPATASDTKAFTLNGPAAANGWFLYTPDDGSTISPPAGLPGSVMVTKVVAAGVQDTVKVLIVVDTSVVPPVLYHADDPDGTATADVYYNQLSTFGMTQQ